MICVYHSDVTLMRKQLENTREPIFWGIGSLGHAFGQQGAEPLIFISFFKKAKDYKESHFKQLQLFSALFRFSVIQCGRFFEMALKTKIPFVYT